MRRLTLAALLVTIPFVLYGCATGRVLVPGGVKPSDAEWTGIAGPTVSIPTTLDPRAAAAQEILTAVGAGSILDSIGVYLPLTVAGEGSPRRVVCVGDWVKKCQAAVGTEVRFAGYSIGGDRWYPTMLRHK